MSKIVAFLQNPWFPIGTSERHIWQYTHDGDFHRRVLAMSMSGQRLYMAFGDILYNAIWWDNANPKPANVPSGKWPADEVHMKSVIYKHEPKIVLAFGKTAEEATIEVLHKIKMADQLEYEFMSCHHPNARGFGQVDLNRFAWSVKALCNQILDYKFDLENEKR